MLQKYMLNQGRLYMYISIKRDIVIVVYPVPNYSKAHTLMMFKGLS